MELRHVDLVREEEGKRFLLDTLALAETGLAELEESYRRALSDLETSRGSDHHDVPTLRRHLTDVEDARRRVSDARADVPRALAIRNAALGSGHSGAAADRAALASLLVAENPYKGVARTGPDPVRPQPG